MIEHISYNIIIFAREDTPVSLADQLAQSINTAQSHTGMYSRIYLRATTRTAIGFVVPGVYQVHTLRACYGCGIGYHAR